MSYQVDIDDIVWLHPCIADLMEYDEVIGEHPMFHDGQPVPVAAIVNGTAWSSIDGSWLTVEFPAENDGFRYMREIALGYEHVMHIPTTTFPGHDEEGPA